MILDNGQLAIKAYCKKIGSNSLLVQGAGGNISWKEGLAAEGGGI